MLLKVKNAGSLGTRLCAVRAMSTEVLVEKGKSRTLRLRMSLAAMTRRLSELVGETDAAVRHWV